MKELEEFLKDIKRIADSIENVEKLLIKDNSTVEKVEGNMAANSSITVTPDGINTEVKPIIASNKLAIAPNLNTSPVTQIPVSNITPMYTQEQLALAMGRAIDMGKMADIQTILSSFNVSSLMELAPDKYNDLALKLREIGVEV